MKLFLSKLAAAFLITLISETVAMAGSELEPWAAQILDGAGHIVCSGALIAPDQVLTARHCFNDPNAAGYQVKLGAGELGTIIGTRIITANSLAFPNLDIAIAILQHRATAAPIALATNTEAEAGFAIGSRLHSLSFGLDLATKSMINRDKESQTELVVVRRFDGYRLKKLVEVRVLQGRRPCRGDSGGAVFRGAGARSVLVGIISGRLEGVGDFSSRCSEGSDLITNVAPYLRWLNGSQTAEEVVGHSGERPQTLTEACKTIPPGNPRAVIVDELLQGYVRQQLSSKGARTDFTELFLKCIGVEAVEHAIADGALAVVIRGALPEDLFGLIKGAKNLDVADADEGILRSLSKFPKLERLRVAGVRWRSSLSPLRDLKLRALDLLYAPCVKDLDALELLRQRGAQVKATDVKECV